ncbi:MAG: hypothetical protein ACI4LZ_04415 [Anaerovoracaceae bacterium]
MAGYVMTLDSRGSLVECIKSGIYSTRMSQPNGTWRINHEGTFADYLSMKSGDNIYFFIKRKIYGIGVLVDIEGDCKYSSFIESTKPQKIETAAAYKMCEPVVEYMSPENRCFCTFKPSPMFFEEGVDMDEALSSDPQKFRMLRAMWKLSFIKLDDEENKALFDCILKKNEKYLTDESHALEYQPKYHDYLKKRELSRYRLSAHNLLLNAANDDNTIKHEMAIEAALCELLSKENDSPLGRWDYVSHQVAASPFKPIDYMDKMDIFGYKYIPGYSTISKYLVVEIKKDAAQEDVMGQIMKYVDWVNSEYAHGNYSMIEAYVVASQFSESVIALRNKICQRTFLSSLRPAVTDTWANVKLIQYEYRDNQLIFNEVN